MRKGWTGLNGDSNFASFHPLVSFVYFCAVILISMFMMHPLFLMLSCAAGFAYSVLLGGWKAARFHLCFLVPILILTAVINPLSNHRGVTVLFYLNGNAITLEAILYGTAAAAMMIGVIMWFSCFSMIMTSDKIIYLLGRLAPVIALLVSMGFRFVPLLKNRFREIHEGQKCMGRAYPKRALIKKARQLAKELSILISWSLEAAIETSDSMEARGYGLHGRTSFHIFKFTRRDGLALSAVLGMLILVAAGCLLGAGDIYFYPAIVFRSPKALTLPVAAVYAGLLSMPFVIDIKGEKRWKKLRFAT